MTRRLASVLVAVLLVATVAAPPRRAQAQDINFDISPMAAAAFVFVVLPVATLGLGTDGIIAYDLAMSGPVRLGASITGTVIWSLLTALDVAVFYGNAREAAVNVRNPGADMVTVGCLASLTWSIYGITRHAPPVAVAPAAWRTSRGTLVPGLVVSARW